MDDQPGKNRGPGSECEPGPRSCPLQVRLIRAGGQRPVRAVFSKANLIERHQLHTGSARAREILAGGDALLAKFVKVMPLDYAKALADMKAEAAAAVAAE